VSAATEKGETMDSGEIRSLARKLAEKIVTQQTKIVTQQTADFSIMGYDERLLENYG